MAGLYLFAVEVDVWEHHAPFHLDQIADYLVGSVDVVHHYPYVYPLDLDNYYPVMEQAHMLEMQWLVPVPIDPPLMLYLAIAFAICVIPLE